jgi:CRP-like cAMP-binding protein/HEAT repeat protein
LVESAFWRLLPDVRRDERSRFLFFLALFFLVTAAETVGLAGSESLFLAHLGASRLPLTWVAASLLAVVGSLAYAAVVDVLRNDRLFVIMLLMAATLLAVVGAAAAVGSPWAFAVLICLFWLYRAVFLVHYWTFAGDHFDTLASKRLFPLFAVGSSAGGVVGGVAAAGMVRFGPAEWLVAVWAALLVGAAVLLIGNARRLLRWIPLEAMEADDTSVERLRGAQQYLRRSSLGRWLIASSLGMVVALFIAQYAYSDIFVRAYPDADQLAGLFGLFLAAANVVEIIVETAVSRWLIPRLGVPTANLLHPLLTLLSFLGLAVSPRVPMAVAVRFNREMLESALANPLRNLTYNALPRRYRGRVRGFLEGIVVNAGMGGAGLLLLVAGSELGLQGICLLGGAAALVYGGANLGVRREYVRSLVDELEAGRLDLREIEREIGSGEAAPLARFFGSLLVSDDVPPARLLGQIARVLARHGFGHQLLPALAHARVLVRRVVLDALLGEETPQRLPALVRALEDAEPDIRLVALRAADELGCTGDGRLADPLRRCLDHADPRVRAAAAAALGDEGWPALAELLGRSEPSAITAALGALPEDRLTLAREHVDDLHPQVRAAALERVGRSPDGLGQFRRHVVANLEHPDVSVRCAALAALARHSDPSDAPLLLARIRDPSREVRILAGRSLVALGEAGLEHARDLLRSDSWVEVEAALGLLVTLATPDALQVLAVEFRRRLRLAWRALLAMEFLTDTGLAVRFLQLSLRDAFGRHVRVAFALLERTESPGVVRTLEKTLRFASSRVRADALEVLSLLGDREGSRLLVALLEEGPLEERSALARSLVGAPRDQGEVVTSAPRFGRFARAAAAALGSGDDAPEVPMERMLLLSRVPLFAQLTLEQLEAIDAVMIEVHYMTAETITREGETGDELFVVLEGEVSIYKETAEGDRLLLSTMGAGSYLGEMAILSDEPRSATAVAACPSRLLSLRGDRLKELILDMPEISFELLRVLTGRVRTVEERLAETGSGEASDSPSPPSPESRGGDGS